MPRAPQPTAKHYLLLPTLHHRVIAALDGPSHAMGVPITNAAQAASLLREAPLRVVGAWFTSPSESWRHGISRFLYNEIGDEALAESPLAIPLIHPRVSITQLRHHESDIAARWKNLADAVVESETLERSMLVALASVIGEEHVAPSNANQWSASARWLLGEQLRLFCGPSLAGRLHARLLDTRHDVLWTSAAHCLLLSHLLCTVSSSSLRSAALIEGACEFFRLNRSGGEFGGDALLHLLIDCMEHDLAAEPPPAASALWQTIAHMVYRYRSLSRTGEARRRCLQFIDLCARAGLSLQHLTTLPTKAYATVSTRGTVTLEDTEELLTNLQALAFSPDAMHSMLAVILLGNSTHNQTRVLNFFQHAPLAWISKVSVNARQWHHAATAQESATDDPTNQLMTMGNALWYQIMRHDPTQASPHSPELLRQWDALEGAMPRGWLVSLFCNLTARGIAVERALDFLEMQHERLEFIGEDYAAVLVNGHDHTALIHAQYLETLLQAGVSFQELTHIDFVLGTAAGEKYFAITQSVVRLVVQMRQQLWHGDGIGRVLAKLAARMQNHDEAGVCTAALKRLVTLRNESVEDQVANMERIAAGELH